MGVQRHPFIASLEGANSVWPDTHFLTCRAMAVPFSALAVNFLRQPFITIALFAKPKASQMSSEEEGRARLARQFERQNGGGGEGGF